jgi:hypothetical protein
MKFHEEPKFKIGQVVHYLYRRSPYPVDEEAPIYGSSTIRAYKASIGNNDKGVLTAFLNSYDLMIANLESKEYVWILDVST